LSSIIEDELGIMSENTSTIIYSIKGARSLFSLRSIASVSKSFKRSQPRSAAIYKKCEKIIDGIFKRNSIFINKYYVVNVIVDELINYNLCSFIHSLIDFKELLLVYLKIML